jgi:broad specificity phosphatase PhoE
MKILLARHADAWNQDGVFHGKTNVPLTKEGEDEAFELAEKLREHNPSIIYSSPIKRAMDTAKIIGGALDIPIRSAEQLDPLDLGEFVGKDTDEYLPDVKHYLENPEEEIPGGESVNEWAGKYIPFFDKFHQNKSNQAIVFLTHGRNIVLTKAHLKSRQGFDKKTLAENTISTEHSGYAIAHPDGKFEIIDPKTVKAGQS